MNQTGASLEASASPMVRLEPQTAIHASELYPLLSEPAVYEFTCGRPPLSLDALCKRFEKLESRRSPDGAEEWLNWVVRTNDGAAVGHVQATIRADGVAEIAYVLGSRFWGAGLAFAACKIMIAKLASEHRVTVLRATVDAQNTRSLRLAERLGLLPTGQELGDVMLTSPHRVIRVKS